jgi:predicted N-acetyltransferase YhbS
MSNEVDRDLEPGALETDAVLVRTLEERDVESIIRIDELAMGRRRGEYFRDRVRTTLHDHALKMSLVSELDDHVVGFLIGSVFYGDFGRAEPIATLDAVGVHPEYRNRHVGKALLRQFVANAHAIGVSDLRTEVNWNDFVLLEFLHRNGFAPSGRLVLERKV